MRLLVNLTVTPASNPETLVQFLAPTNRSWQILGMDLSLRGDTPTGAIVVLNWCIQNAGTSTGTITPIKLDRGKDEVVTGLASNIVTFNATGSIEPSTNTLLHTVSVHEQSTLLWRPRFPIIVKTAERVGLRYLCASTDYELVSTFYLEGD